MPIVLDASVAVKLIVSEDGSRAAERIFREADELHAPRIMASEIANVLWRKVRQGEITRTEASELASVTREIPFHWADDESLTAEALRLALSLGTAVYDCVYLALAHQISGTLVTADGRFARTIAGTEHAHAVASLE